MKLCFFESNSHKLLQARAYVCRFADARSIIMTPDGTCVTALDPVHMTKWNAAKSKHPLWKDLKIRRKVIWDKLKVTF